MPRSDWGQPNHRARLQTLHEVLLAARAADAASATTNRDDRQERLRRPIHSFQTTIRSTRRRPLLQDSNNSSVNGTRHTAWDGQTERRKLVRLSSLAEPATSLRRNPAILPSTQPGLPWPGLFWLTDGGLGQRRRAEQKGNWASKKSGEIRARFPQAQSQQAAPDSNSQPPCCRPPRLLANQPLPRRFACPKIPSRLKTHSSAPPRRPSHLPHPEPAVLELCDSAATSKQPHPPFQGPRDCLALSAFALQHLRKHHVAKTGEQRLPLSDLHADRPPASVSDLHECARRKSRHGSRPSGSTTTMSSTRRWGPLIGSRTLPRSSSTWALSTRPSASTSRR